MLISCRVTTQLICAFVFSYANSRFPMTWLIWCILCICSLNLLQIRILHFKTIWYCNKPKRSISSRHFTSSHTIGYFPCSLNMLPFNWLSAETHWPIRGLNPEFRVHKGHWYRPLLIFLYCHIFISTCQKKVGLLYCGFFMIQSQINSSLKDHSNAFANI